MPFASLVCQCASFVHTVVDSSFTQCCTVRLLKPYSASNPCSVAPALTTSARFSSPSTREPKMYEL